MGESVADGALAVQACSLFSSTMTQDLASVKTRPVPKAKVTAQIVPSCVRSSGGEDVLIVVFQCLSNLFLSSQIAAEHAWKSGFLATLATHITRVASGTTWCEITDPEKASMQAMCLQQLLWGLRVLGAFLGSSLPALAQALDGPNSCEVESTRVGTGLGEVTGRSRLDRTRIHVGTHQAGDGLPEVPLAMVLRSVRGIAEKDEQICIELMGLLQIFANADATCEWPLATDIQQDELDAALAKAAWSDRLSAFLLRTELIHWMMRLSEKPGLSAAAYSQVMAVLSLCAPVLSGKPALLRYFASMVGHLHKESAAICCGWRRGAQSYDERRIQRLSATLNFIASMRLCPKSVDFLVGSGPVAHSDQCGITLSTATRAGCSGMDFWLDLVEAKGRQLASVQLGVLRVLLAVLTSSSLHAKSYFVSSCRSISVLAQTVRTGATPVATLALNVLWLLAHKNLRAAPLLKRHQVIEASLDAVARAPAGTSEADYIALMAKQLSLILK